MRKRLCCLIAALILVVLLPGCGAKDAVPADSPQPTAASTVAPERTSTPESPDAQEPSAAPEPTAAPKPEITQDMAYAGVNNYCHITYDWSIAEEIPDMMYVANCDETETEYVVMFRSYTGAYEYFYVDKASGVTRIVSYEPVQQKETDEGTINIWDYLETGG